MIRTLSVMLKLTVISHVPTPCLPSRWQTVNGIEFFGPISPGDRMGSEHEARLEARLNNITWHSGMFCLFIRWWTHEGFFGGCAEVTTKWPQNHNKSLFVSCEMGNKIKAQFVLHITSYVVLHAVSPQWLKFYPLKTRSGNSNSHTINYYKHRQTK